MHERSERREIAMRIGGPSPPTEEAAGVAIRTADPEAELRLDPATGIAHVRTRLDTLEVEATLVAAGFEVTAPTG